VGDALDRSGLPAEERVIVHGYVHLYMGANPHFLETMEAKKYHM
jgi:hypothetical protein